MKDGLFDVEALSAALEVLASQVGLLDASCVSSDGARRLLALFVRGESICAAGKTVVARRVETSNAHEGTGHRDAASFVAAHAKVSVGDARSLLATGRRLESLDATACSFRSGALSSAQVTEVARGASVSSSSESALLDLARRDSLSVLQRERARLESVASGLEAQRADFAHRRSTRCLRVKSEGSMVSIWGRFTTEDWAPVQVLLSEKRSEIFRRARKNNEHESFDASMADALCEIATSGSRKPKATVNVLVDHAALRRGYVEPGEQCEIPGVGPISVDTAKALVKDCWLNVLVTKGVDVTTVASESRYIPPPIKRALSTRNQKCSIRGCDTTAGLEVDHRRPFKDQGPTSLENLALLCRFHHQLKTHKGYQLRGPTGDYELVSPDVEDEPTRVGALF